MYIQSSDLDTAIHIQPGVALTLKGFTFKNINNAQNVLIHNQGDLFLEDIIIELPKQVLTLLYFTSS
jgi:hypothetical protein